MSLDLHKMIPMSATHSNLRHHQMMMIMMNKMVVKKYNATFL